MRAQVKPGASLSDALLQDMDNDIFPTSDQTNMKTHDQTQNRHTKHASTHIYATTCLSERKTKQNTTTVQHNSENMLVSVLMFF